ncbi:hypothetical protein BDQ94DRAFT_176707 [Aspergillus welwitschiae]|uniref:Uncharacterized protein n=1 Tax=Aspergillus welwitschiae TaxID=1341132 RepID=A0A3F3PGS3_9EURO|nr:hypothetical protein BDQ94DRAFT_176707 [Aspergillus welwitschiae]RDH26111.1 hypothetical protein BDQ94DRAFT_176707 [Aspergillus welwitschiae]
MSSMMGTPASFVNQERDKALAEIRSRGAIHCDMPLNPSLPIRGEFAASERRNISPAWKGWKFRNTAVP